MPFARTNRFANADFLDSRSRTRRGQVHIIDDGNDQDQHSDADKNIYRCLYFRSD